MPLNLFSRGKISDLYFVNAKIGLLKQIKKFNLTRFRKRLNLPHLIVDVINFRFQVSKQWGQINRL
jgi:hypothetical protein